MAKMHGGMEGWGGKLNGGGRAGGRQSHNFWEKQNKNKQTKVLQMKVYPVLPEDAEVFG